MCAWPVARSIFDAPLGACEGSERADKLDNMNDGTCAHGPPRAVRSIFDATLRSACIQKDPACDFFVDAHVCHVMHRWKEQAENSSSQF